MAKKYCTNCGKEIEEDAKFCPYCGQPVFDEDTNQAGVQPDSNNIDNQPTDVYQRPDDTQYNQDQDPYNTYDYTNPYNTDPYGSTNPYNSDSSYEEEEQDSYEEHSKTLLIIIIVAVIVAALVFCGIVFGKDINGFFYDHTGFQIPFLEQAEKSEDTDKAEVVSTPKPTETTEATPIPTETPVPTETPIPTAATKTGTVYINASAKIQDINVRNKPSTGSGTDTGKNVYPGDKVTIYETIQSGGYTWYRIGDNEWIADNGSSFGVKLDDYQKIVRETDKLIKDKGL